MKTLVTGAEGFVGRHLVDLLEREGDTVVATSRDGCVGRALDLPDDAAVLELLDETQPDVLIHLAAISSVGIANANPSDCYRINVNGTASLLNALGASRHGDRCHFILISTSAVYGRVSPAEQPIREQTAAVPVDTYAWTKLAAEALLHGWPRREGQFRWTILRPFNHTGPGQSPEFVLSSFARQVASIERGEQEPILRVGNLDVRRDFVDVRDVVRAYRSVAADPGTGDTFNICSGDARRLRDLLDALIGFSEVAIDVEVDPERLRGVDLEVLVGDADALRQRVGWRPQIELEDSLRDLLDYWRHQDNGHD